MEPKNTANELHGPLSQPQKFSRYRSVRAKSATAQTTALAQPDTSLARTPSRYHRKIQATNLPPLPSQARSPAENDGAQHVPRHVPAQTLKETGSPVVAHEFYSNKTNGFFTTLEQPLPARAGRSPRVDQQQSHTTSSRPTTSTEPWNAAREEARMILEGEFDRLQKLKKQQEKQQLLPGSEAPDLTKRREPWPQPVRNHKNAERARHTQVDKLPSSSKRQGPQIETQPHVPSRMRTLVNRANTKKDMTHDAPKQISKPMATRESQRSPSPQRAHQSQEAWKHPVPGPQAEPVRAFDAPVSAVNAGDRRVEIKCDQASITLPVTPSTTVKDLLRSVSLCMSENIDPKTAVLLESFSQLGLERPLRRYERIRDVMNSWDTDGQNYLIVLAASECDAVGLEKDQAPTTQPNDTSLQIYHSPKPGKWEKHWVKLREDGQVSVSKHENGEEATNICHLSDFDLYTPTRKQAKKLKAPKKICIAIKSQQKSAMFLQGLNFVHFFCTNDKQVADQWYNAVQSWRSWYLIHVMGEGQKKSEPVLDSQRPGTAQSQESMAYQLGSFKPLLDFSEFRLSVENTAETKPVRASTTSISRKESMRKSSFDVGPGRPSLDARLGRIQAPPSSFPRRTIKESIDSGTGEMEEAQLFTGGSLLARSASRRSQSGHASGRGVPGAKGKPLVDLAPTSEFTDGSLLRKMEAWVTQKGAAEPRIDREKRFETTVRVGEGFD